MLLAGCGGGLASPSKIAASSGATACDDSGLYVRPIVYPSPTTSTQHIRGGREEVYDCRFPYRLPECVVYSAEENGAVPTAVEGPTVFSPVKANRFPCFRQQRAAQARRAARRAENWAVRQAATAAFGHLLHHRYRAVHGYWACPASEPDKLHILCEAEFVRAGRTWYQVRATATLREHRFAFSHLRAVRWQRRRSAYSRRFILRSRLDAHVPGVISVNGPAYDWGLLAGCAAAWSRTRVDDRGVAAVEGHCSAYDGHGHSRAFASFDGFICFRSRIVTCKNKLGDVMRYRAQRQ